MNLAMFLERRSVLKCEFLYASHEQLENENLKTLFTTASKSMKYLGINGILQMTELC